MRRNSVPVGFTRTYENRKIKGRWSEVGEILKGYRDLTGMTMMEFAAHLTSIVSPFRVTHVSISEWEAGIVRPKHEMLRQITSVVIDQTRWEYQMARDVLLLAWDDDNV